MLTHPVATLVVLGLLVVAWKAFAAVWWPFVSCPVPHCERGRVRSPSGKAWRRCRWCKGTGTRLRWGRRVVGLITGLREP